MKLYMTYTSPYARLARIVVIEKGLADRVEVIEAKTRTTDSPYYRINPSGRVPFLLTDEGLGMEDSQVICAYLDSLDGNPRFHSTADRDWAQRRLEATARSMLDGIAVWAREMSRPESERSPMTLAHEAARAQRLADAFEAKAGQPVMRAQTNMAQLVLAIALETARVRKLGDLTAGRPQLAAWLTPISERPSMLATAAAPRRPA